MSRVRIVRDGDGWAVHKNGRRHYKKTYSTKQAARRAARRAADDGQSVQEQRTDGTWGRERTRGVPGPDGNV